MLRRSRKLRGGPKSFDPTRLVHLNAHTRKSLKATSDRRLILELPASLDFEANYEATVSHFSALREATQSARRLSSLKFDHLRHISPAAALVLASEVDRWNHRVGRRLKAAVESWDKAIARLLCQMGYFELLGIERPLEVPDSETLTFLRFKRGDPGDRDAGKLAQQLRLEIEACVGFGIQKHFLFEGLSEAITNVCQHAYPVANNFPMQNWWLSASYDRQSRELCVIFYDQGAGIPCTLPTRWKSFELVKVIFNTWTDSQKIEAAMEVGRSSSGRAERGKGLQNLVEFAKTHREGRLSIYSLQGMYRLHSKRQSPDTDPLTTTERQDHQNSIGGTLIEWSVKL
jgi:hypothetical protein